MILKQIVLPPLFSYAIALFILIIPLFGNGLSPLTQTVLTSTTLIFFVISLRYQPVNPLPPLIFFLETLILLFYSLSIIHTPNLYYSFFLTFQLPCLFVLFNLVWQHSLVNHLQRLLITVSLLYSFLFLLQPLSLTLRTNEFLTSIPGHSNLSNLLVFTLLLCLFEKRLFLSILFSATLLFTQSRAALLAVLVALPFLPLSPRLRQITFIPLFILFITFSLVSPIFNHQKTITGLRFQYWSQALTGFLRQPLIGNGPGSFYYLNKELITDKHQDASFAFNSLLNYLTDNGLFFTALLFAIYFIGLKFQFSHSPLFFTLSLSALVDSFFDSSWSNLGILLLSFIFCLSPLNSSSARKNSLASVFQPLFAILILAYLIFFNLKPIPPSVHDFNYLVEQISKNPRNDFYYQELLSRYPLDGLSLYCHYLYSHLQNFPNDLQFQDPSLLSHFPTPNLHLALYYHQLGLKYWSHQQFEKSLDYLQLAVHFAPDWAPLQIELANAYWHSSQPKLAQSQIEQCLSRISPRLECQLYSPQKSGYSSPGQYVKFSFLLTALDQFEPH